MRIFKVAYPVLMPTWTKMTKPSQYRFNMKLEKFDDFGSRFQVVFDPIGSEGLDDYTSADDIDLNRKEASLLENAIARAARKFGGESADDYTGGGELQFAFYFYSAAYKSVKGNISDDGVYKPTLEEKKDHLQRAKGVANELIRMGFKFDRNLRMFA